ncbi:hypothetical protein QL285_064590 [Trifolium repens]|nr:hypothetical protein QL285_064590 [Trifolium repens]
MVFFPLHEQIRKGQPCKNHIKYIKRRRSSYANKGLKCLLYNSGLFEKQSRESFYDDIDEEPEEIFHATFDNRHYRWSFSNMRGTFSEHSTYGTILGLSPTGPVKIEDVKDAIKALRRQWQKKNLNCADAYKTLCNDLSPE